MNLQVGVKVLIKNSRGEYLFLRRTKRLITDKEETSWDIPGGRIDGEEPLIDALKREIKEEIGHDLRSTPKLLVAQDIFVPEKELHVVRLTYEVDEDVTDVLLSDEHDDFKWVKQANLQTLNAEPYLAEVLSDL